MWSFPGVPGTRAGWEQATFLVLSPGTLGRPWAAVQSCPSQRDWPLPSPLPPPHLQEDRQMALLQHLGTGPYLARPTWPSYVLQAGP